MSDKTNASNSVRVAITRYERELPEVSIEYLEDVDVVEGELSNDPVATFLAGLSENWTSMAIGFFEVVPQLAWLGHFHAEHEMADAVELYVSSKVSCSDEITDENSTQKIYYISDEQAEVVFKRLGKANHSQMAADPPPLTWSTVMFRKTEETHG